MSTLSRKALTSARHSRRPGKLTKSRENNLIGAQHIRYGGYGGIAYHHIADSYIALFTSFIPCGVWEAIHILDGLMKNRSVIQPDTLHADTQGQSVMWTGCVPAVAAVVAWERSAVRAEVRHGWGEAIRGCRQQAYDRGRRRLWCIRAGRGSVPCPPCCPRLLAQHRSRLRLRPWPPLALPRRRTTGLGPADSGARR